MSNYYEEPSMPDMDVLVQRDEIEPFIRVPVSVEEINGPVTVHHLPARDAVMRNVTLPADGRLVQLVGMESRRSRIRLWATSATAFNTYCIGTAKDEVEASTATLVPAVVDTGAGGVPFILDMTHRMPLWAKNVGGTNIITVSYIAELWAD